MTALFISDLHLDIGHPEIGERFSEFVRSNRDRVTQLYILGDLFESWVGDDDPQPEARRVISALRQLSDKGVECFLMHGNRDFLIGTQFAEAAGAALLPDEIVINLGGEAVLLMHGDSLCTDDHEYQAFRSMVRNPDWQLQFLSRPLAERLAMASEARAQSQARNANAPEQIMDVNQQSVEETMRKHGVRKLLHGHTHRPAIHDFSIAGQSAQRIVLGDWYDHGSMVTWDANGPELIALPR